VSELIKELLPAQDDFVHSTAVFPALIGGFGSGKTEAGICRAVKLLIEDKGISIGYYMPTYDLIRLRAMEGFENILSLFEMPYTANRSGYNISVEGYGSIILRSYDRPERIVAYEVAHSIVDELDTLKKEDAKFVWRKVTERNRQQSIVPNSIGCVTTSDNGYNGFAYERWGNITDPRYELIQASTYNNPYLPEGYIQNILDNYDPIMAGAYLRGEFVSFNQNKVYHFFNRNKHHTSRKIQDTDDYLYIGVDFNIGGCCAVVFVIENNIPYAVDEFISHDTHDIVNNLAKYKGRTIVIHPDASGNQSRTNAARSDIQILRDAGFSIDCPIQNPAIRDRVNSVNSLLAHDRFFVNTDTCKHLTHSLETQAYVKGEPEKFSEHPAVDDWNDAMGYFINRKFGIVRSVFTTTKSPR
jgi:PBSX family phage terminase large subunit